MRVVVVGVCASGKTTLVRGLRAHGHDARSVAQEHSNAPHLFQRRRPDFVVALDCSMATIRRRRDVPWGEERLAEERRRLAEAYRQADLVLTTDDLSPAEVLARTLAALRARRD